VVRGGGGDDLIRCAVAFRKRTWTFSVVKLEAKVP
jgi:hypothetical protein